jgi:DNA-directed RNA polymerase subunit beta
MSSKINERISFASITEQMDYPDFLDIQLKSFRNFFQLNSIQEQRKKEGLYKVFSENYPITDTRNNFVLEFLDYNIDPPRYTIDECLERGLTYSVPLKAKLKLYCTDPEHEDFDTVIQEVYLGVVPYMTERGTFVINGAERVIVSQLHRSPGVFFGQSIHANGTKLYSARIIPFKGSWIEFATDINNVMYAYIDRKKKLPVTTLLRAIGYETDKDILEIFDLAEEFKVSKTALKKLVGRKLAARVLKSWVEDFVDEDTGEVVSIERNEVIIDRETILEDEHIEDIVNSGSKTILLHNEEKNISDFEIIFNTLQKDPCNSEKEAVVHIYRQLRNSEPPDEGTAREVIENLFFSDKRYDLGDVGRFRINRKLGLDIPMDTKVLTMEDIIKIIKYLIELINSKTDVDDIDHLSNRRVRTVGEQLHNQFGVGLARMARTIRERMNVRDNEVFTPVDLINSKTLSSVINSFFGTNQLSQFMDQTNPLAEMTHKRRMSALGPGGLSRERAGFEVRDVHYTHYGRLCPIETPEGPNIGLISSLCVYAKINLVLLKHHIDMLRMGRWK